MTSLVIYNKWKKDVKEEEDLYDNRPSSEIMYKARTNNLQQQDRKRHQKGDTKCFMCDEEVKDVKHFMLWCTA